MTKGTSTEDIHQNRDNILEQITELKEMVEKMNIDTRDTVVAGRNDPNVLTIIINGGKKILNGNIPKKFKKIISELLINLAKAADQAAKAAKAAGMVEAGMELARAAARAESEEESEEEEEKEEEEVGGDEGSDEEEGEEEEEDERGSEGEGGDGVIER